MRAEAESLETERDALKSKVERFWRKPKGCLIPPQCDHRYKFGERGLLCDRPKHDDGEHWCCIEESARVVWHDEEKK